MIRAPTRSSTRSSVNQRFAVPSVRLSVVAMALLIVSPPVPPVMLMFVPALMVSTMVWRVCESPQLDAGLFGRSVTQLVPSHSSIALSVVLRLRSPLTGLSGRWSVVPEGRRSASVAALRSTPTPAAAEDSDTPVVPTESLTESLERTSTMWPELERARTPLFPAWFDAAMVRLSVVSTVCSTIHSEPS